jgi:hypothetical protein
MGATTIACCSLWDRVASEAGLSEEALRQLMKGWDWETRGAL